MDSGKTLEELENKVLPIPIEKLPLTQFTYARTVPACFVFNPSGPSKFFFPSLNKPLDQEAWDAPSANETDPCLLFLTKTTRQHETHEVRGYLPSNIHVDGEGSYWGKCYEFDPEGSSIPPIQGGNGTLIIPAIICEAQTYHESGLCITMSISFRNLQESKLFAQALEWEWVKAIAAARSSG